MTESQQLGTRVSAPLRAPCVPHVAQLLPKVIARGAMIAGGLHAEIGTKYFRIGHMVRERGACSTGALSTCGTSRPPPVRRRDVRGVQGISAMNDSLGHIDKVLKVGAVLLWSAASGAAFGSEAASGSRAAFASGAAAASGSGPLGLPLALPPRLNRNPLLCVQLAVRLQVVKEALEELGYKVPAKKDEL